MMRQFFSVLYGGLAIIIVTFAAYLAADRLFGEHFDLPEFSWAKISYLADAVGNIIPSAGDVADPNEAENIIRYTAAQEEDMVNSAASSLPKSSAANITASAYAVKDLKTRDTAASKDADKLVPIASLTKLVTAEVAKKSIAANERVTITKAVMDTYGNTAQFRAGETFMAEDLLYPLLMVSSNDAAEALARTYGRKQFIQAMNDFTQSIGAYRTYFADPSGLSKYDRSTANDLAIILDWLRLNDPSILEITRLKSKAVRNHEWTNPAHFLNWSNYGGGKNGYTAEAALTTAALFTFGRDRDAYAVVLLGSDSRDSDMVKLLAKIKK